jgi:hypothetical protein
MSRPRGRRECRQQFLERGERALVSTAVELAIFFRAQLVEHRLLPEGLLHHMKSVLPDDPRPPSPTGWG